MNPLQDPKPSHHVELVSEDHAISFLLSGDCDHITASEHVVLESSWKIPRSMSHEKYRPDLHSHLVCYVDFSDYETLTKTKAHDEEIPYDCWDFVTLYSGITELSTPEGLTQSICIYCEFAKCEWNMTFADIQLGILKRQGNAVERLRQFYHDEMKLRDHGAIKPAKR